MVDEFDEIIYGRKSRWPARILINGLIGGMLLVGVYALLVRAVQVEIPSVVASWTNTVSPRRDGQIVEMPFRENDRFQQGDLLFRIEDKALRASLEKTSESIQTLELQIDEALSTASRTRAEMDLTKEIQTAQSGIRTLEATIKSLNRSLAVAQQNLATAQEYLTSMTALVTSRAATGSQTRIAKADLIAARQARDAILDKLDVAAVDLNSQREALELSKSQLENMKKLTADRVNELRIEKDKRAGELAAMIEELNKLTERADFEGYIVRQYRRQSDNVKAGDAVLQISESKEIWIEAWFPPEHLPLVHEGDVLAVRYVDDLFPVRVRRIGPTAMMHPPERVSILSQNTRYVPVRIDFIEPGAAKAAGLRAGYELITLVTRREGLIYRLGLRGTQIKARSVPPPADEPTTGAAEASEPSNSAGDQL